MPTPTKGRRLGGSPAHQRQMMANLATALFEHGRITTTQARARRLRPVAERLITFAKRGDLHARRQVLATVTDRSVVHTLFAEIGPRYETREGGYTRITKIGARKGDNAPMAVIELLPEETEARPRRRRARRSQPAARPGGPQQAEAAAPAQTGAAGEEPVRDASADSPDAADSAEALAGDAEDAGPGADEAAREAASSEADEPDGDELDDEPGDDEPGDDEPGEDSDDAEPEGSQ